MLIYASSSPAYFAEHGEAFIKSAERFGHKVKIDLVTDFPQLRHRFIDQSTFALYLRYFRLPDLLDQDVLMLDIDSIINAPIKFDDCDMALFFRPWVKDEYRQVLMTASFWTPRAKRFAERVRSKMVLRDNRWYDDQWIVWETFQDIGREFRVQAIDQNFVCYDFNRDAPIWTCKGPNRKSNQTYLERRAAYA